MPHLGGRSGDQAQLTWHLSTANQSEVLPRKQLLPFKVWLALFHESAPPFAVIVAIEAIFHFAITKTEILVV